MKKVLQLFLTLVLISSITVFYYKFFDEKEEEQITISEEIISQEENNIIKNLTYEVTIREDNDYQIKSESSEITYDTGVELVLMNNVTAILKNDESETVYITSDKATYNSKNFNTIFEKNIQINYLDNKINAEKMILNFGDNLISVSNNVRYTGPKGVLKTDNININLITKKINLFMNQSNKNVTLSSVK